MENNQSSACIDQTGDEKKEKATDYVAKQYIGNLGRTANGIVSVNAYAVVDNITYPLLFKDELDLCLKLQPDGWLTAQKDQSLLGMVGAVNYGSVAQVALMAVHPAFQGQGIGRILLESLLKQLDLQGCPIIRLEANGTKIR